MVKNMKAVKKAGYLFILAGFCLSMIYAAYIFKLYLIQGNTGVKDNNMGNIMEIAAKSNFSLKDFFENNDTFDKSRYKNGGITIIIPKINITAKVMKDTKADTLKYGPGIYEKSPLPDIKGANVCIAGHRTTYGKWFLNIDKLSFGDDIILIFNKCRYFYSVEKVFIIANNDWSVTYPQGYSALTLTSCHPPGSAKQRIAARARLYRIIDENNGYIYEDN